MESLLKIEDVNFKIIVVDNSTKDSLCILKSWSEGSLQFNVETSFPDYVYPTVSKPLKATFFTETEVDSSNIISTHLTFIKANRNDGFAAANNIALRYILRSDTLNSWVWLLNNDTVVSKDVMTNFRSYIQSEGFSSDIGIVGTKLYYYKHPKVLQGVGGAYNPYNGKTKHIGAFQKDLGQYDDFKYNKYDYVIGASMFVSAKYIMDVGFLCEDYFLYYEEIDWITRGRKKKWSIGFLNSGIIYHKEGASIDSDNTKKSNMVDYYICRNILLFTTKNLPDFLLPIKLSLLIRLFIRLIHFEFIRALGIWQILFKPKKLNDRFNG